MCIGSDECDCHLDDFDETDEFDYEEDDEDDEDEDEDNYPIDGVGFADPGGVSALRAETEDNPRDRPCPTCGEPNRLTRIDEMRGYQCDRCSEIEERGF